MSRGHSVEAKLAAAPVPRHVSTVARPTSLAMAQRAEIRNILRGPAVQTKLTISEPGDEHEREADRVADEVMRMPDGPVGDITAAPGHVQRMCDECEDEIQRKPDDRARDVSHALAPSQRLVPGLGRPLPTSVRQFMEPRFGHDFSRVRIHTDGAAARSAAALHARAYTLGHDLVFGAGRYAPATDEGRRLLAHELVHVVQQGQPDSSAASTVVQRAASPGRGARLVSASAPPRWSGRQ